MIFKGFSNKKAWVALWAGGALIAATTVFAAGNTNSTGAASSQTPPPETDQKKAQQAVQKENEKGAGIAQILGIASVGLGGMMIYQGKELTSKPEPASQAAGYQMILQGSIAVLTGLQSLQAKEQMKRNANDAAYNAAQIDSLGSVDGLGDGFKIDSSYLKDGEVGKIMDGFEKSTGIPRDYLASALEKGVNPFDLLANAPKGGMDKKLLGQAKSKAEEFLAAGGKADLAKYGLDPEKIAASLGESGGYGNGGGGRSLASAKSNKSDFDSLFGANQDQGAIVDSGGINPNDIQVSPEVQKALGRAGISDKTIFQMVSARYKARTPFLFGLESKKNIDLNKPFDNAAAQANRGEIL